MENEQKPLATDEGVEPVVDNQEGQTTEGAKDTPKTYTQEEVDELLKGKFSQEQVNEIIEKRLGREKGKVAKAQEEPENNEELIAIKGQLAEKDKQILQYEKEIALSKYEIEDKYREFVDYKVSQSVSDGKDYKKALEEFMAGEGQEYVKPSASFQMPRPKNTDVVDDTTSAMDSMAKAMGLK